MLKVLLLCLLNGARADYSFEDEPSKVHWTRHGKYDLKRVKSRAGHSAKPTIMTMDLTYTVDGDEYEGYVAYPTKADPKRPDGFPGMVISHAWYGLAEGEKMRAEEAAKNGYVAFALDMYGKGKRATDRAGAMQLIGELNANGPEVVKMRAEAGLDQLRAGGIVSEMTDAVVDESMLYAAGYCAGAIWATEMARNDWGVKGVSVFHANYANLTAFTPKMADVWMQYHHAAYDRVGDEGLLELETYLEGADVKVWETVKYGGTNHGFSDPTNSIFDERAAAQAHASMYAFFKASMPEPACEDSTTWHKKGNDAKNCKWVADHPPRCDVKSEDRVKAKDACPCACPVTRLPL